MNLNDLSSKLCKGVEGAVEGNNDYVKVEKVLAPFLKTLKKRKRVRADILPEEYEELYLKRSPKEILTKLQSDFVDPLGIPTLLNEMAELLKVITLSKSVNLYLTDYYRQEILLCPKYIQDNERFEKRYAIGSGTFVAPHVAFTKEYVISSDILGDVRFPQGIPDVGPTVKSVICIPIITNIEDNCIGIIELYRDCTGQPYDLVSLQICTALTAWMGIAIEQNNAKLALLKELEIQRHLSGLANAYFSGAVTFNKIVSDIIKLTKATVNAERGGLYFFHEPVLINSEETLSAEAYEEGFEENEGTVLYKKRDKVRYVKNEPGIPGYAARTGNVINIRDAYKDFRFNNKTDSPFFRTRSIVAFPIKNEIGVIAVLTLINSLDCPYFRKERIEQVQYYLNCIALICGYFLLDTAHGKMHLKLSETKQLLEFHTKPSAEELTGLRNFVQTEPHLPSGFSRFDWDMSNCEDDAHKYIAYVFLSSGILEPCFDFQNLADFLFRVKKAHRPLLYHNFEHDFGVFHCVYVIISKNKDVYSAAEVKSDFTVVMFLKCIVLYSLGSKKEVKAQIFSEQAPRLTSMLSECISFWQSQLRAPTVPIIVTEYNLQIVTLLLAALCHSVDHLGVTNGFLALKNDIIYKLYGDFCGEAHRYEVTLFLIQSTDLLSNVSPESYQLICKNLKRLMMSFDLAIHFQNRIKISEIINSNSFDWENPEHRYLSQSIILTTAESFSNFKSFDIVKKFTSSLYKEFFRQGDMEKSMGFSPLPILDRNKIDVIPENQVILLSTVFLPCIEILITMLPNLSVLLDLLNETIQKWKEIIELRGQEVWKPNQALPRDRKEKRSHRVTLSSTLSSLGTLISNSMSER